MVPTAETLKSVDERFTATDARKHWSDLLGRTEHAGHRFVITQHGAPAAALIPVEDVQLLEVLEDAMDSILAVVALENDDPSDDITLEELRAMRKKA